MEQTRSIAVTPIGAAAVVAHDAGGAEILSSWVRRHMTDGVAVLGGPAIEIFNRKVPNMSISGLAEAIYECDWMLVGTGNSGLEYKAMAESRKAGLYIVAFLDHWTAYKNRFTRDGQILLPDEIWIGDYDALRLVRRFFPGVTSTYVGNPYWQDALDQFNKIDSVCEEATLLFLSSNVDDYYLNAPSILSDHWLLKTIIDFFQQSKTLPTLDSVTVRKHPSESANKYTSFSYPGIDIRYDFGCDLIQSIARNKFVAGQNSMGQVIGKLCGRKTINFLIDSYSDEPIPSKYVDEVVYLPDTM